MLYYLDDMEIVPGENAVQVTCSRLVNRGVLQVARPVCGECGATRAVYSLVGK